MADNCFPAYNLEKGKDGVWRNMHDGVDLSTGGYVFAQPGMYMRNAIDILAAITFDAASLHPTDAIQMNYFGIYTKRFAELLQLRLYIKHRELDKARKMFGGSLARYLQNEDDADGLSTAIKTIVNAQYGVSYASFPNPSRDPRNVNNIIALRGALVMHTLQENVTKMGYHVIHIKTDSIKIANPDEKVCNYILKFGQHYGITFEVEHTWDRICLVNDAVFVGLHANDDPKSPGEWETTGKQFQVPFVRKSLFTHEPIEFYDICQTVNVRKGELHLVFNAETDHEKDNFIGHISEFVPMKTYGGTLYCYRDGKRSSPSGTKGQLWMEAEAVKDSGLSEDIDISYWRKQADKAIDTINKFGSFDEFVKIS